MYQKKDYNTLRLVANFTSGFGWIIVGILAVIGLIVGWKSGVFSRGFWRSGIWNCRWHPLYCCRPDGLGLHGPEGSAGGDLDSLKKK